MAYTVILGAMDPAFWHALLWSVATLTGVGVMVQGLLWLFGRKERPHLTGLHCKLDKRNPRKKAPQPKTAPSRRSGS